jgi:hypothetical protein
MMRTDLSPLYSRASLVLCSIIRFSPPNALNFSEFLVSRLSHSEDFIGTPAYMFARNRTTRSVGKVSAEAVAQIPTQANRAARIRPIPAENAIGFAAVPISESPPQTIASCHPDRFANQPQFQLLGALAISCNRRPSSAGSVRQRDHTLFGRIFADLLEERHIARSTCHGPCSTCRGYQEGARYRLVRHSSTAPALRSSSRHTSCHFADRCPLCFDPHQTATRSFCRAQIDQMSQSVALRRTRRY